MDTADVKRDEDQPQGLTLVDYIRVARTYWKAILAFTLALTLAAFVWLMLQPKLYASDSTGIVVAGGADNLGLSLAGDNLAKSKAKNYQSLAGSRLLADRVIADLSLTTSADALLTSVTVVVPSDTSEIKVTATSEVPQQAQQIADAWVQSLAAQVAELESAATGTGGSPMPSAVRVVPLGKAVLPDTPVSPNVPIALAAGLLAGLALGLAYAFIRNHLDRRLRTVEDVERLVGVPVIGTIPVDHRLDEGSYVVEEQALGLAGKSPQGNAISEALRELRTNLQFIDVDNPPRIIVVTSSVPSEGKSTVTANLAVTMASAGENIVVVDGDLRRPTVANVFRLVPGVGVTDVLSGHAEVSDVLQQWGVMPNLQVLGSGRIPPNPSELLGSKAMSTLLRSLAQDAIVLIDAPPLLPVTDAVVLSRLADGAIVVVRSGKTMQEELIRSIGNLRKAKGHILGTILNCVPLTGSNSYSYYGAYGSHTVETDPVRSGEDVTDEFDSIISSVTGSAAPTEARRFTPIRPRRPKL